MAHPSSGRPAAGDISLEPGLNIMLTVNPYGIRHPEFLRALKKDDLAALVMNNGVKGFEEVNDETLVNWSHLSGLQELNVASSDLHDAVFAVLEKMPKMQAICFEGTMITGKGCAALRKLKKLEYLNLNYTSIGDEGLRNLDGVTGLLGLELKGAKITDKGLPYLHGHVHLRDLTLSRNKITDAGLAKLPVMPDLIGLGLEDTGITDALFAQFGKKYPKLRYLYLRNCRMTKKGLVALSKIPKLENLNMAGAFFSLDELRLLKRFPSLKSVVLSVPRDDEAALRKDLKGVEVVVDNHHSGLNRDRLPPELFAPLHSPLSEH